MIEAILQNADLFGVYAQTCEENGIGVDICQELADTEDQFLVLKVDQFYSSHRQHNPPPSIDCLIVIKRDSGYDIFLVELRNTGRNESIRPSVIEPKFITTIEQFMSADFGHIFLDPAYRINQVSAFLVTDPLRIRINDLPDEVFRRRIAGTVLEQFLLRKPLNFRGHPVQITPKIPRPHIC